MANKNEKTYIYTVRYHSPNFGHTQTKIEAKRYEFIDKLAEFRDKIKEHYNARPEIEVISVESELKVNRAKDGPKRRDLNGNDTRTKV
jgi:hypothetical protein